MMDVAGQSGGTSAWPRSLHVGNVANVAYGYAKILTRRGAQLELICHDITHLMSQPEWDDLELDPKDFPDEGDFGVNTADLGDYRRPPWFRSARLAEPSQNFRRSVLGQLARRLPTKVKRALDPLRYRLRYARERGASLLRVRTMLRLGRMGEVESGAGAARLRELAAMASRFGPAWRIDPTVLACYLRHRDWLASHAAAADVIFSYALAPIYASLYARKPSISVEIGTMRDIPFGSSALARVLWLAYRLSDHVVITNPDNREAAERAGIQHYSFCPHPVDETIFFPAGEPALRRHLQDKHAAETLLFAPARQNWRLKGNDKILRGLAIALAHGINAVLLIPAWGQEIARSKALCRALGIESRVAWLEPMPEPLLARHYRAVDLVLDQFELGVFGLITPKAMACGAPVLTSYERRHNAWCFPVDPPLLACGSSEEIGAAIARFAGDRAARREIGTAARRWIEQTHSSASVADRLRDAMERAMTTFKARRPDG